MRSRRLLMIAVAVLAVALVAAWWAFRPELLVVDARVSEPPPTAVAGGTNAAGRTIASGQFRSHAHETRGTASIVEVDGRRVLRLTGFSTSNGPDVHVTLVAAADATDDATVRRVGYVSLGSMKGNVGDQNYELPGDLDLSRYQAVTIWCERFSVNFGTAALART